MSVIRNWDCDAYLEDYHLKWGQVLWVQITTEHNKKLGRYPVINQHVSCKILWQIFNYIIKCFNRAPHMIAHCGKLYHQVLREIDNRVIMLLRANRNNYTKRIFHKESVTYNQKNVIIYLTLMLKKYLSIQYTVSYTTVLLSWHVQNCDLISLIEHNGLGYELIRRLQASCYVCAQPMRDDLTM